MSMVRTQKIVSAIYLLLVVTVLIALDWQFGGLRFVSPRADFRAGIAALWLPAVCVILLSFLPRSRARLWGFLGLVPFAVFCLLISFVGSAVRNFVRPNMMQTDVDPTFEQRSRFRLGHSDIVTYWSNAGAMDSGEVVIQQEITLLPGLLWVHPISHQACLRDVIIKVVDRHHMRCDYVADTSDSLDPSPQTKHDEAWVF